MKIITFIGIGLSILLMSQSSFAEAPVTLTGPTPAIPSSIIAGTSSTFIYTVTNHVPKQALPLTVSGISGAVTRTQVSGDCGNNIPAGPSTCNIGVTIAPQTAGVAINQKLIVDYQGRISLTSPIVSEVITYAYVTPTPNATSIDQFLLGNDGLLSSYTSAYTANGPEVFGQMTFATTNGIQYAYILDPSGTVYWCSINANGSFNNCMTVSATFIGIGQARAIAFATFNAQYSYIVDPGNNNIYQCSVDAVTGDLSSCQIRNLSIPLPAPYGIAFATDNTAAQHAYIADAGIGGGAIGYVLMCSMLNDGDFGPCTQTPAAGAPNWVPYAVAFTRVSGVQYAYVADNGSIATPGHVYRCQLNSEGSFVNSSCISTPTNESSLVNWYPYYIAFQTVGGTQYAYVVNNSGSSIGNIYRCTVGTDGFLSNCVMTPNSSPSPWQPTGIAFRN